MSPPANMASPSAGNSDLDADCEQTLMSYEKLDRSSPDLWPEQIPGVSEFAANQSPFSSANFSKEIDDQDDIELLQEFGSLTTPQLMEKVRGLQNLAFKLGLDEAREMTRGKFLNILQKQKRF